MNTHELSVVQKRGIAHSLTPPPYLDHAPSVVLFPIIS